jgi:nucleotide-binding universal stress UspA family protein
MTVIVGFDDTPCGQDAINLGQLLGHLTGQPLLVVAVWPGDETGVSVAMHDTQWVSAQRARAEAMINAARTLLGESDDVSYQTVGPGSAARGLHDLAEERDATVIVVGSSADTMFGRICPGSTGERLLHGAPCPVAVAPRGYRFHDPQSTTLHTVAVAYVDSDEAREAVRVAALISEQTHATVRALTVTERSEQAVVDQLTAELAAIASSTTVSVEVLAGHDAAAALTERSAHGIDLMVCGSRGYGPIRSVLLGGVSRRLIRTAACPVLVVPRGAGLEPDRHRASTEETSGASSL